MSRIVSKPKGRGWVAQNRLTCGVVFYPVFVPAGLCPGGTKATRGTQPQHLFSPEGDLAIKLEEPTQLPVDVEHILAAIVMAARQGELDPNRLNANGVYSNKATLAVNP